MMVMQGLFFPEFQRKLQTLNFHSLCSQQVNMSNKRQLFFFEFPLYTFTLIHSALHILFTMPTLLCEQKLPDLPLLCCSAPQPSERNWLLYHIITHTVSLYVKLLLPQIVLCMVQLVVASNSRLLSLLHPSPEYHSDPVGASDRDLFHPAGVFRPMLFCLHFIPGSALLPSQEETQKLWQSGERHYKLSYSLCCFQN